MAKDAKSNSNAHQRATSEPPDRPAGPLSVPVSSADRDVVKVNNANVTELKNACDDAVKRVRCLTLFTRNSLTEALPFKVPFPTRFVQANSSPYRHQTRLRLVICLCGWWYGTLRIQSRF